MLDNKSQQGEGGLVCDKGNQIRPGSPPAPWDSEGKQDILEVAAKQDQCEQQMDEVVMLDNKSQQGGGGLVCDKGNQIRPGSPPTPWDPEGKQATLEMAVLEHIGGEDSKADNQEQETQHMQEVVMIKDSFQEGGGGLVCDKGNQIRPGLPPAPWDPEDKEGALMIAALEDPGGVQQGEDSKIDGQELGRPQVQNTVKLEVSSQEGGGGLVCDKGTQIRPESPPAPWDSEGKHRVIKDRFVSKPEDKEWIEREQEEVSRLTNGYNQCWKEEQGMEGDEVLVYGNVVLTSNKMDLLSLGPGFMIVSPLDHQEMSV